ncbi:MAG: carboxymuconolactone decarboxylase family protein [Betaproteobacteria bacterium]|nr:carboxymuconolactone decarboxylase family protein [Betaproteobacteria bacterium]
MQTFPVHTIESAPEKSRPALQGLQQNFGLVPNLAAMMAGSPTLVNGFVGAFVNFHGGTFGGGEKQVLLLTNAVTNGCAWAVAFHSAMALKEGVAADAVAAIRGRELPRDRKLAALSGLTRALIEKRGHLDQADLALFLSGGFEPTQIFEAIAGLAISVMANYAGNIGNPPLEEAFRQQQWQG